MTPALSGMGRTLPSLVLATAAISCLLLSFPWTRWKAQGRRPPPGVGRAIAWTALLLSGALVLGRAAAEGSSAGGPPTVQRIPADVALDLVLLGVLIPVFIPRSSRRRPDPLEGTLHSVALLLAAALLLAIQADSLPVLFVAIEAASLAVLLPHGIPGRRTASAAAQAFALSASGTAVLALGVGLVAGATGELRFTDLHRLLEEVTPPVHRGLLAAGAGLVSLAVLWKLVALPVWLGRRDSPRAVPRLSALAAARVTGWVVLWRWVELLRPLGGSLGGYPDTLLTLLGLAFLVPATVAAVRARREEGLLEAALAAQTGLALWVLLAPGSLSTWSPAMSQTGLEHPLAALALSDTLAVLALASHLDRASRRRGAAAAGSLSTICAAVGWASLLGLPFLAGFAAKARAFGSLLESGHALGVVLAGAASIAVARTAIPWSSRSLVAAPQDPPRRVSRLDPLSFLAALLLVAGGVYGWLGR